MLYRRPTIRSRPAFFRRVLPAFTPPVFTVGVSVDYPADCTFAVDASAAQSALAAAYGSELGAADAAATQGGVAAAFGLQADSATAGVSQAAVQGVVVSASFAFDATGAAAAVETPGEIAMANEIQRLDTKGEFFIGVTTSEGDTSFMGGPITAENIEIPLNDAGVYGEGAVSVTDLGGGIFDIEWVGNGFEETDIPEIIITSSTATIATVQNGGVASFVPPPTLRGARGGMHTLNGGLQ